MFDHFLIRQDSLKNDVTDGKVTGFSFAVKIADYRGCFLSLHNGYYVECDGIEYDRKQQTFEVNGRGERTFEELKKCVWEHWDFADEARLHIKKEDGLTPGKHKIRIKQSILMQYGYAPWDEEWVENPPIPGKNINEGKSSVIFSFELELADGGVGQ